ncbi:Non-heme chloroperoxidase [Pirellula sp. SH-Sr6A]|uniref:alpha/beta fold hydrolase n=1 Tax=Pirellula sp. SH-Sr6A TaxID=1632865 RepID=UPI00078D0D78|nr:alpha/beta hydrolase [Pirellula sp. SH-Sr6A]AMV31505.1 Non-heme chloroperoxidase [Pirellula sp. SH-Sr6A]
MPTVTTNDGASLYYKDWGSGQPLVFSHGWPLSSDAWDEHMLYFASRGYRCIAHDRRGHGLSTQTWHGNDMNTYADDLATIMDVLNIRNAVHVGHSTGGGEVARYIARHGTERVSGAVLIGAVTPVMLQSETNPKGVPMDVFDTLRANLLKDRSQLFKDFCGPFFGTNRTGSSVSKGAVDAFWLLGMQAGLKNLYDCIAAFSQTDQTDDLKKMDIPTLIVHGDDDQVVPIDVTARVAVKLIPNATLQVYPGAPHALTSTHRDQLNADVLAFVQSIKD